MKQTASYKRERRVRRHTKIRARITGTEERPRLSVYRSLSQISAQIIDDATGKTLVSVETADLKGDAGERKGKVAQSFLGGKQIAELAKAKKISAVVFDRGGFRFHGRVRAFAEGAREGGLVF